MYATTAADFFIFECPFLFATIAIFGIIKSCTGLEQHLGNNLPITFEKPQSLIVQMSIASWRTGKWQDFVFWVWEFLGRHDTFFQWSHCLKRVCLKTRLERVSRFHTSLETSPERERGRKKHKHTQRQRKTERKQGRIHGPRRCAGRY